VNPIEQICKSVKRDRSPLYAPDLDSYRTLISEVFHDYADRLNFAESWIERFISI
jgi:ABC-type siderophore export system fused ATPase/permease subunit